MSRATALLLAAALPLAGCGFLDEVDDATGDSTKAGRAKPTRVEEGVLAPGDEQLESGEWVDVYVVEGAAGQRLDLRLVSDDFDTFLGLVAPDDGFQENDDDDEGASSIRARLESTGPHRVFVTSYQPGESGDYRLEITLGAIEEVADVPRLEIGDRVEGELVENDDFLWEGEPVDVYRFDAEAGSAVRVTLQSADLDSYLELAFPDGTSLSNDDDWERHERSRIELTLPQTGTYEIYASAYWQGERGAYTLSLEPSRAAAPLRGAPARIYALLAGISDYGGRAGDLEWTADDARKLQRVLVDRVGVAQRDTVLLVDDEATVAAFRDGVAELASRMTSADELLIFYSGHGDRVRRSGFQPADPDAVDETLLLYDGNLLDDDVAAMLEDVPGRVLLVLDSCFAGGFAKDVISRPGRMGIFSSEEDVTSSVAEKFQAGGYLSAYLAQALTGDQADDGDGVLTTLELSHFLHERFRVGVKGSGPDDIVTAGGPMLGYQRLVVDRGSLAPTDILFQLDSER